MQKEHDEQGHFFLTNTVHEELHTAVQGERPRVNPLGSGNFVAPALCGCEVMEIGVAAYVVKKDQVAGLITKLSDRYLLRPRRSGLDLTPGYQDKGDQHLTGSRHDRTRAVIHLARQTRCYKVPAGPGDARRLGRKRRLAH